MSRYARPPNTSLYIRNVPDGSRPEELRTLFTKYGPVSDVYIPLDHYTRRSRGFAYVQLGKDDCKTRGEAFKFLRLAVRVKHEKAKIRVVQGKAGERRSLLGALEFTPSFTPIKPASPYKRHLGAPQLKSHTHPHHKPSAMSASPAMGNTSGPRLSIKTVFPKFEDPRDAEDAMYNLDRTRFFGRELEIEFARGDRKTPSQMRTKERGGRRVSPHRHDDYYDRRRRRSRSRSPRDRYRSASPRRYRRDSRSRSPRKERRSRTPRSRSRSYERRQSPSPARSRSHSRSRSPNAAHRSRSGSK